MHFQASRGQNIQPTRLWAWAEEEACATDRRLTEAVGTLWAMTQIEKGHPRAEALAKYRDTDDTIAKGAIEHERGCGSERHKRLLARCGRQLSRARTSRSRPDASRTSSFWQSASEKE
jgi:hypothetical protein